MTNHRGCHFKFKLFGLYSITQPIEFNADGTDFCYCNRRGWFCEVARIFVWHEHKKQFKLFQMRQFCCCWVWFALCLVFRLLENMQHAKQYTRKSKNTPGKLSGMRMMELILHHTEASCNGNLNEFEFFPIAWCPLSLLYIRLNVDSRYKSNVDW